MNLLRHDNNHLKLGLCITSTKKWFVQQRSLRPPVDSSSHGVLCAESEWSYLAADCECSSTQFWLSEGSTLVTIETWRGLGQSAQWRTSLWYAKQKFTEGKEKYLKWDKIVYNQVGSRCGGFNVCCDICPVEKRHCTRHSGPIITQQPPHRNMTQHYKHNNWRSYVLEH